MIFDFRRCFYETDKWELLGYYSGYRTEEDVKLDHKEQYVELSLYLPETVYSFKFWGKDAKKVLKTMSCVIRSEDKIFCWNGDFEDESRTFHLAVNNYN